MIRYQIIFSGQVQHVGFRVFCQMNAVRLNLTGYAYNLENGMVLVQIQGEEINIQQFIKKIKLGNQFIHVDNYAMKKMKIDGIESSFSIK